MSSSERIFGVIEASSDRYAVLSALLRLDDYDSSTSARLKSARCVP